MYRVDSHKHEMIRRMEDVKTRDYALFYGLLVLIILIGINSLVSTALWIKKFFKTHPPATVSYNKQLNESQMVLNETA